MSVEHNFSYEVKEEAGGTIALFSRGESGLLKLEFLAEEFSREEWRDIKGALIQAGAQLGWH